MENNLYMIVYNGMGWHDTAIFYDLDKAISYLKKVHETCSEYKLFDYRIEILEKRNDVWLPVGQAIRKNFKYDQEINNQ